MESYYIRYWKENEDGTHEDGIAKVPDDITNEEAQRLIQKEQAVEWYIDPKTLKEIEKMEDEVEEE